jgi:uncharacterized protein
MKKIFLALLIISACKNYEKPNVDNGLKIFYYPNGKIQTIKYLQDSLLTGECFWFYPNGRLEKKITYDSNQANGPVYFFYESGNLKSSRFFNKDLHVGYTTNYFDDSIGLIQSIFIFNQKGKLIYRKEFDSSGQAVKEEGQRY